MRGLERSGHRQARRWLPNLLFLLFTLLAAFIGGLFWFAAALPAPPTGPLN